MLNRSLGNSALNGLVLIELVSVGEFMNNTLRFSITFQRNVEEYNTHVLHEFLFLLLMLSVWLFDHA